jgi:predicted acetyltransferase
MQNLRLTNLKLSETTVLQRLLQLYYFESTTWSKEDICSDGLYDGCTASDLEVYVDGDDAKAYLIWVGDNLVGFVLLDKIELEDRLIWELADFFILPKYRGAWVALESVRQILTKVGQAMSASTFKENKLALRFFKAVAKRVHLDSVRELKEEESSPFYTFIVNESVVHHDPCQLTPSDTITTRL